MSAKQLDELLQECTVRLKRDRGQGTGFFVAPGLILTCAHVVERASNVEEASNVIDVFWASHNQHYTAQIENLISDPNVDLALLRLSCDGLEHPCVYFDQSAPKLNDNLYIFGYPLDSAEDYSGGDSVTVKYEGRSFKDNALLYKLKEGQIKEGFSGSPLLNLETGNVCGIVNISRNTTTDLGGRAVPTAQIFEHLASLKERNCEFHQRDSQWEDLRPTNFPRNINSPQNIPHSERVKFVGREKVIETLHQQLEQTDQVAITGMGGVGKTELAIQYAWQYWEQTYPGGVCWLQATASDLGEQMRDFAELQMNLVVPEELKKGMSNQDQQGKSQAGKRVAEWFWQKWQSPSTQPALVIVDDVTNYKQVKPYLPPAELHFKVLMTTRLQLDKPLEQISLAVLEKEPAVELLRQWIEKEKIDQQLADAKELSSRLGYLPLALNLVGRYVSKRRITLAEMLKRLEEKGLLKHKALEVDTDDKAFSLNNSERGVAAAFELNWGGLSDVAKELACLLSLLPFTPYRWKLVEKSISALASIPWQLVKQDTEDLEDARVELEGLHLLQGEEAYRLHPLIREFFRKKLEQYPGGDDVKRVIGMVDPDPNRAILPADFGILPTVNEFVGYPGCYVACYSRTKEGSQYSVGGGIHVMGQVRVPGRYQRRICKPEGYENADISAKPEFKERCAKNLPKVCQGDTCWAGGDTGGWFGIRE